jgi:hypothetical protein
MVELLLGADGIAMKPVANIAAAQRRKRGENLLSL